MTVQRLNITLTVEQWEQLDSYWKRKGYASRSEFIRQALRNSMVEEPSDKIVFAKPLVPTKAEQKKYAKEYKKVIKTPKQAKKVAKSLPGTCKHGSKKGLCKFGC